MKNEDKNELQISKFYIYENVFLLIDILPQNKREKLSDAILQYMFKGCEPSFKTKELQAIWINLKLMLDSQKIKILNGSKNTKTKHKIEEKKVVKNESKMISKTQSKTQSKNNSKIYIFFRFLISNFKFNKLIDKYSYGDIDELKNKIIQWCEYKLERKETYKERGLNALLTQIENNVLEYGMNEVCNLIDECMASNYKGIIFDKLKKQSQPYLSFEERKKIEEEKMWENFFKEKGE